MCVCVSVSSNLPSRAITCTHPTRDTNGFSVTWAKRCFLYKCVVKQFAAVILSHQQFSIYPSVTRTYNLRACVYIMCTCAYNLCTCTRTRAYSVTCTSNFPSTHPLHVRNVRACMYSVYNVYVCMCTHTCVVCTRVHVIYVHVHARVVSHAY